MKKCKTLLAAALACVLALSMLVGCSNPPPPIASDPSLPTLPTLPSTPSNPSDTTEPEAPVIPDELYESALMQAIGAGYTCSEELASSAGEFWNSNNRDGIVTREPGSWEEGDYTSSSYYYGLAIFELPTSIDDTSAWQEIAQSIQSKCNGFNVIGYRIKTGVKNGRTVKYLSVAAARGVAC